MKVLTVALKAIKLSDQCINSKAAFEKQVYMKAYNEVHSLLPPVNAKFLITGSFLPQKVLVQVSGMEKQFIKY